MKASKTKMWAVPKVGEEAVTFEVDRTVRPEIEAGLVAAGCDPFGSAYYVDLSDPERPNWACTQEAGEGLCERHHVPAGVREACALWLPAWAGRHCAEGWHDEERGTVEPGTTFDRWRLDHGGLPARGDVDYLRDCTWRLLGREPSETERRAFGQALLERLFELTPVASDGEVAA